MLALGLAAASSNSNGKVGSSCLVMKNFANAQYIVEMQIGSPPQTLKMIADSGSSDLVVPSRECSEDRGCGGMQHKQFDTTVSKSFAGPYGRVDTAYGQGETECVKIRDAAIIGGLTSEHQDMLLMTTNGLSGYSSAAYDGILGMGIEKMARKNATSFLTALPCTNKFTMCIGNRNEEDGVLYLGDERVEALDWAPQYSFPARPIFTADIPFWGLYMSKVAMSTGVSLNCEPKCAAIVDSGSSLISLPAKMLYTLLEQLPPGYSNDCGNFSALPELTLTIEGQQFKMKPRDYMVMVNNDDLQKADAARSARAQAAFAASERKVVWGNHESNTAIHRIGPFGVKHLRPKTVGAYTQCTPAFTELDETTNEGPMVVLGLPFLRAYATTFDRSEEGKKGGQRLWFAEVGERKGVCSRCGASVQLEAEAALGLGGAHVPPPRPGELPPTMGNTSIFPSGPEIPAMQGAESPITLNMSAVRLPWWAAKPAAKPAAEPRPRLAPHLQGVLDSPLL